MAAFSPHLHKDEQQSQDTFLGISNQINALILLHLLDEMLHTVALRFTNIPSNIGITFHVSYAENIVEQSHLYHYEILS